MTTIYALISLLSVLTAAALLARMLRMHSRVGFVLTFGIILSTLIVLQGYTLSAISKLNDPGYWALVGVATLALVLSPLPFNTELRGWCLRKPEQPKDIEQRVKGADYTSFSVRLLVLLAATATVVAIINIAEVAMLEPATPDAHQYHLARMVFYLQQGNLHYFSADYWAQVVYPKVATILHLYTYLMSGNLACMTQLVQFIAYFISMLAVYGICRQLGQRRQASAFAGLIFGLLIICITESSTAQNDMILTAFIGTTLYFMLTYRKWRSVKYLLLACTAFALAAGVKATFLVTLPSLGLIAAYALFARSPEFTRISGRHLGVIVLGLLFAGAIITLPSGYWDNLRIFHDPFGPRAVRASYTQEGTTPGQMTAGGMLNVLRYGVDFLVLDGWYPLPHADQVQRVVTSVPHWLFRMLRVPLESRLGVRKEFPFSYRKSVRADETFSSWGMVGFLLLWPVVWLVLLGKRYAPVMRIFAGATVLYYLVLCFIIPYDPFHGRFFTTGALFALPPLAAFFAQPHSRFGRGYLTAVLALGCLNTLIAASFRTGTSIIPHIDYQGNHIPCAFGMLRTELLTREAPGLNLLLFETVVPKDATVYLDSQKTLPAYLFFGEENRRRLVSLLPFWGGGRRSLPKDARFILCDRLSPHFRPRAERLTESWYPIELYLVDRMPDKLPPTRRTE